MSYCRMSPDSDIYAFPSKDGFVCMGCGEFDTRGELALDLLRHLERGERVPDYAFERLFQEIFDEGYRLTAAHFWRVYERIKNG